MSFERDEPPDPTLEWIVTNGLGGYASGPVRGGVTRRFHGLLIASLPAPVGRLMCLNLLRASLVCKGREIWMDHEDPGALDESRLANLCTFELINGLPVWTYEIGKVAIEKRIAMTHGRNTTHVIWSITSAKDPQTLRLQPAFEIRPHEGRVDGEPSPPSRFAPLGDGVEIDREGFAPTIRWRFSSDAVAPDWTRPEVLPVTYDIERARGYDCTGGLWSPGWIDVTLEPGTSFTFTISTEDWPTIQAMTGPDAFARELQRRDRVLALAGHGADLLASELTLAADQFVVTPFGRQEDLARARAEGDDLRTVIAGYHWFTDWGRDTMISLEGLTLATGRVREAGAILRTFGHYVRNGLIPNMFPEGAREGLYHTADATLWFFHALHRYLAKSGDRATLEFLLPTLVNIAECHVAGTHFGIGVDPDDGLLRQGAEGYQLTWMDAKVGDWVVTPRRGKAVEINALWYNALRLLARWLAESGQDATPWEDAATTAFGAFNDRFWNPATNSLFDVVDGAYGDDPACRPNQVFAISLDHPVLAERHWRPVMDVVRAQLLTPMGLRTLSPSDPQYQRVYHGDLLTRDAAYHQGTVWPWLIGAYVDAYRRTYPDDGDGARALLTGLQLEMNHGGVGTIGEICDGEAPYTTRGCISQAWSVAELLRSWLNTPRQDPDGAVSQ